MMMTLELALDDARCLNDHLVRHIAEVEAELAHTERREMRHQLAVDLDVLRVIQSRLARLLVSVP